MKKTNKKSKQSLGIDSMKYSYTILALSISVCSMHLKADVVPNSGLLLQQQQLERALVPQSEIGVESFQSTSPVEDSNIPINIKKINIEGNTRFSTEKLHALVKDLEGKQVTLSQLMSAVERITQYYYDQDYIYSYAYLPEQTLEDGNVRIAVLEAKFDQTVVNNNSRAHDWLIDSTVAPLKRGDQIDGQKLEQQLKLINRLNGIYSSNVLSPGNTPGSSQLTVTVDDDSRINGYIGADNYGSLYTDQARLNTGIVFNNLAGLGDELSFDGLTSGKRLNYGKIGYAFTFNGRGTRLGASYSHLKYEIGRELEVLEAEGSAAQSSIWLSQPLILTNTSEFIVSIQYDHKKLEDDINLTQYYRHRDINLGTLRLEGSHYDQLLGGGLTQFGLSASYGELKFRNEDIAAADELTANTQGNFYTSSMSLSRLQNLGSNGTQGYLGLYGQYSPDNLDTSEQYSSGGPYNVRGYESSQFSGSSGYFATLELRQTIFNNEKNQISIKAFADTAQVKLNAKRWEGVTGDNTVSISSAGLGFNWYNSWNIQANAEVGFPIGKTPEEIEDPDDSQYWISIRKTF